MNVQYADNAGVVALKSDTITLAVPVDSVPPVTTSNAQASYSENAVITLTASDDVGGSGVKATYYRLDGGVQTTGTVISTSVLGAHTVEFWSVDNRDNFETPHGFAAFTVTAPMTVADFVYTGSDQYFTVPSGVTSLSVDLYGAQGGSDSYTGGLGGRTLATIAVTPGQVLTVRVGGAGMGYSGGWPNGGTAGHGAGGGGSSSLLSGGTVWLEAGAGGGGSCDDGDGGSGGYQGWLPGGNSDGGSDAGSGGGGGWNGGPGMTDSHGADPGGGGSSYIGFGSGTLTEGVNWGNGSVQIVWSR